MSFPLLDNVHLQQTSRPVKVAFPFFDDMVCHSGNRQSTCNGDQHTECSIGGSQQASTLRTGDDHEAREGIDSCPKSGLILLSALWKAEGVRCSMGLLAEHRSGGFLW